MSKGSGQSHEAIVFFADGAISKQMQLMEFDALLDGVVPMRDFAGKLLEVAYVRLNAQLIITAAVFFKVQFDERGYPDSGWNVPINQMADNGVRGPDLGAGQIRLATHSQCPLEGREDDLWDPSFGASGNTLLQLQEALKENRLGFDVYGVDGAAPQTVSAPSAIAPQVTAPVAATAAAPAPAPSAGQADAVMAAMQQYSEQLNTVKEQHRIEIGTFNQQLAELHEVIKNKDLEKQSLHQKLEEYASRIKKANRIMEAKLVAQDAEAKEREQALLDEREAVIAEQVATRTAELEQGLAEQERRREQQEEQLNSLRAELTELRRSDLRLLEGGADDFLQSLKDKGVKFMAFHPGAGHVTIALEDLNSYMQDTDKFIAERCKVSVEHYKAWLAHYQSPTCQGHASRDALCGKPVPKQLKPAEFVIGIHDRCDIHRRGELPQSGAAS